MLTSVCKIHYFVNSSSCSQSIFHTDSCLVMPCALVSCYALSVRSSKVIRVISEKELHSGFISHHLATSFCTNFHQFIKQCRSSELLLASFKLTETDSEELHSLRANDLESKKHGDLQ